MGLTVKETGDGKNYDPVPADFHHAICYAVYDLGTQNNPVFNKEQQKVVIIWELPEERINIETDDGPKNLPRAISKIYTASLHEKANLRRDLESWRNKEFTEQELAGFNLAKLLGVNATLQVTHKRKDNKVYANVSNVLPLMKNMEKRQPENPVVYFDMDESMELPERTPQWIKDIIAKSKEWQEQFDGNQSNPFDEPYADAPPPDDDDIPF